MTNRQSLANRIDSPSAVEAARRAASILAGIVGALVVAFPLIAFAL